MIPGLVKSHKKQFGLIFKEDKIMPGHTPKEKAKIINKTKIKRKRKKNKKANKKK